MRIMKTKNVVFCDALQQIKAFLVRWFITALVLSTIVLISYTPNFSKYGFSKTGKLHHSYLDYPNEISSVEALELSHFVESLDSAWNIDKKIYYPFERESDENNEKFWVKEVDVKDSFKRSQVIHTIAKDMGLPEEKFPRAHSHHAITDKLKNQIHKSLVFSSNHLHINNSPKPFISQCDIKKLNHHKSTVITFSSKQFQSTNIKLDGLFSPGGRVNFRTATPSEEQHLKQNIKFNLTLFAHTTDLFKQVSISQVENEVLSTKNIHIKSHHLLESCLVYNLDIIFPASLKNYNQLDIKVNHADQIDGDLESIMFKKFSVGLGRGEIHFRNLLADEIWLGTLNGFIVGHYFPVHKFGAASVNGITSLEISPQSTFLKSTVVSLNGPVKAKITDDKTVSKSGGFTVHCWLCEPAVVANTNTNNIHVTSSKRESIKRGYLKEQLSAHINVHSRQGESKLVYA